MDYDTLIYAIIAIAIFAKLWSVLGQRNPEDHERPNPFAAPPTTSEARDGNVLANPAQTAIPLLLRPSQHAPDSLAGGLEQIKAADPNFDEKQFLQGARAAFTLILSDFAKGDLAESAHLLAPTVLTHFREAIEARRNAGQSLEHKLITIRDAECAAAKLDDGKATIAVRYISEQQSSLRDNQGNIVSGSTETVDEITDLWTFTRDTKSPDPNWILVETQS